MFWLLLWNTTHYNVQTVARTSFYYAATAKNKNVWDNSSCATTKNTMSSYSFVTVPQGLSANSLILRLDFSDLSWNCCINRSANQHVVLLCKNKTSYRELKWGGGQEKRRQRDMQMDYGRQQQQQQAGGRKTHRETKSSTKSTQTHARV